MLLPFTLALLAIVPIPDRAHTERTVVVAEDGLVRTRQRRTLYGERAEPSEVVWTLDLPEGAALSAAALETADGRLEGQLVERRTARRTYDAIVHHRRDPLLVERVGERSYRLSVFPVLRDVPTYVEVEWVARVPVVDGRVVVRVPPGGEGEGTRILDVTLRSSVPLLDVVASSPAVLVHQAERGEVRATYEGPRAELAGELVISARVAPTAADLSVALHRADGEQDGWFTALVTPPPLSEEAVLARDVVLVVDTSGSMEGEKLAAAQRSVLWLLDHLRAGDRVAVVRFASDVQSYAPDFVPASPANLDGLRAFVTGFQAGGSTDVGAALQRAADLRAGAGRVGTLALLTDGRPTLGRKEARTLVGIARLAAEGRLRVHTFGVGQDLDGALLRGLASAGGGRAEVFLPEDRLEERLTAFLARTSAPTWTDLTVSLEGAGVELYDVQPRTLPDLHFGEQALVCGRFRGAGAVRVSLVAHAGDGERTLSREVDFPRAPTGSHTVRQLFALQKLATLEDALRMRAGLPDEAYFAALDRGALATEDEILGEMVALSRSAGVQCSATSFLVLTDADRTRVDEVVLDEVEGDPDMFSDAPFESVAFSNVLGIGGGPSKVSLRIDRGCALANTELLPRLAALADSTGPPWTCANRPPVETVGLAALLLQGLDCERNSMRRGPQCAAVQAGVKWLREQVDLDTGRLSSDDAVHAVGTCALVRAYHGSRSPLVRNTAQSALDALLAEQAADGAWSDLRTTAWSALVLVWAQRASLKIAPAALDRALDALERAAAAGELTGEAREVARLLATERPALDSKPRDPQDRTVPPYADLATLLDALLALQAR